MRILKFSLYLALGAFLIFFSFVFWAKGKNTYPPSGFLTYDSQKENVSLKLPLQKIKLMTYNIGFASGDKNNKGSILTRDEVIKNLDIMADVLKNKAPDVVALQEVDFDCHRTFNINQMEYLAKAAGYTYAYYTLTWNKRYVAWPYWPLKLHFRKVVSGQAILSKYPFDENSLFEKTFEKPQANAFWYNWFYLDRIVQKVTVALSQNLEVDIWNVHLEAFSEDTRREQTELLAKWVNENKNEKLTFVMGDFNSPSSFSKNVKGKDREELIRSERSITRFSAVTSFITAPSGYTIPSWDPERKIDHIFYPPTTELVRSGEVKEIKASDHLAVYLEYTL